MLTNASVKAPGKILWIGGYSVLERPNISYVTAVDAYVTAKLEAVDGNNVEFNAPQLGMSSKGTLDPKTGHIHINVPKELELLKAAAEIAVRYAVGTGKEAQGFKVTTSSDSAFAYSIAGGKIVKSGLGSSAAVTVATVGSVLQAAGISHHTHEALHKLAQTAHSIATGKVGSGFDIAAASFGSILYKRYSPEIVKGLPPDFTNQQLVDLVSRRWDYEVEKFQMPKGFKILFANFGESMITTKAVGSVSDFKKNDPHIYFDLIKELNEDNNKAVKALKAAKEGKAAAMEEFRAAFDHGRSLTKKLGIFSNVGIEPDDCTELIEESKKNGAFVAKLPGAGGKDAIAAISLDTASRASLRKFWKSRKLNILKVKPVSDGAL